ncbi:MAG: S8 family serine peptidase [Bdellovibrionales bacterium]
MRFSLLFIASVLLTVSAHAHPTFNASLEQLQTAQTNTHILNFKLKQGASVPHLKESILKASGNSVMILPVFRHWQKDLLTHPLALYYYAYYAHELSVSEATDILHRLSSAEGVEYAYFEPYYKDAGFSEVEPLPVVEQDPLEPIPNLESEQYYLKAAPDGMGAFAAWKLPGGTGKGLRVLDIETGWFTDHVEFAPTFYDNNKNQFRDHGTAVWGEIAAKRDGVGTTGIAYEADFAIAGHGVTGDFRVFPKVLATVIEESVLRLSAGDVMILPMQVSAVNNLSVPVEYFPEVFEAVKATVQKGIFCIAAAGNSEMDLDHPRYDGAFDLRVRDSGCIIVGATESPMHVPPRVKADYSNFGSRVDVAGFGRDLTTTGFGNRYNARTAEGKLASYTSFFNGTSAAVPLVAGAVVSTLGILKAKGIQVTPLQMREALRATGTPQTGDTTKRIGNLPEIKQLVQYLTLSKGE